ncbi:mCG16220 [Mus musculus]|nr:mCG16220 [Mus musculus]
MVKATKKRHNLIQDVVPSTTTSKPKRVMNCLIPDAVPSTWTSEPKTVDTCLTPDVEPSTSTAEPKTVKICLHQFQSKCSKKIRRPKVPTMKNKKTLGRMLKKKASKNNIAPKRRFDL